MADSFAAAAFVPGCAALSAGFFGSMFLLSILLGVCVGRVVDGDLGESNFAMLRLASTAEVAVSAFVAAAIKRDSSSRAQYLAISASAAAGLMDGATAVTVLFQSLSLMA